MKKSMALLLSLSFAGCTATAPVQRADDAPANMPRSQVLDIPKGAIHALVHDVDGDGRQDIVAVTHGGNQATVFRQAEPGKFVQSQVIKEVGFHPNDFVPWPGEGGRYLIAVAEGENQLQVYEKDAKGRLNKVFSMNSPRPRTVTPFHSSRYGPSLAVLPYGGGGVHLLLGFDPLKGPQKTVAVQASSNMAGQFLATRLDAAANDEILLPGTIANVLWKIGGLDNDKPDAVALKTFPTMSVPVAVAAADIDGDGRRDALVTLGVSRKLARLMNGADGIWREAPALQYSEQLSESPTAMTYGMERNGEAYVILGGEKKIRLWHYMPGAGVEQAEWPVLEGQVEGIVHSMQLADLDGDGWLDLVVAQSAHSTFNKGVVVIYGPLKDALPRMRNQPAAKK